VQPSGRRFVLPSEVLRVKVEEGKVQEIVALKGDKSGLVALYECLAGESGPSAAAPGTDDLQKMNK